jgi:hypothetical protein
VTLIREEGMLTTSVLSLGVIYMPRVTTRPHTLGMKTGLEASGRAALFYDARIGSQRNNATAQPANSIQYLIDSRANLIQPPMTALSSKYKRGEQKLLCAILNRHSLQTRSINSLTIDS